MPGSRDLSIYRGDTYDHEVTVVDANEDPVDLSDRTWAAQVRTPDGALGATFTVDDTSAAIGVLVLSLTPDDTAGLTKKSYDWDLQGTYVDDAVQTLLAGKVTMSGDATRP